MKKTILILTLVLAAFMVMGCYSFSVAPVDASNNPVGSKVGEATATVRHILFLPLNYTIEVPAYQAASNGGITKIATVDVRQDIKKGFFVTTETWTTIVTGE
jgi:riboflavin transporter FmnP